MTTVDQSKTGLNQATMDVLMAVFGHYSQVENIYLFGSRAKGNYKPGSDIDLAISGEHANYSVANHLNYTLNEETPLPYYFDVVLLDKDTDPALRQHISQYAIQLK